MSEFKVGDDEVESEEIFTDKVDTLTMELVAYIRRHIQGEVDKYNKNLVDGDTPKCVICETEEYLEELAIKINGNSHKSNEAHDIYHEVLNKQFGAKEEGA